MGFCLKALLIEDNYSDAQRFKAAVGSADRAHPPNLQHVDCFEKALDMLRTTPFNVILLNLRLPDGEGPTLVRQIKQVVPQVPVVVMIGTDDIHTVAKALSAGADDYLSKSNTFSPQCIAEKGYTDVGNFLVQRLNRAAQQFTQGRSVESQRVKAQPNNPKAAYSGRKLPSLNSSLRLLQSVEPLTPAEQFAQSALYSVGVALMSTLGILYMEEGRYGQAEPMLEGALEIRKQLLGATHPDVIVSLYNLATLYDNRGDYIEAESLFYEALKLAEDVFGSDSSITRKFRRQMLIISRLNQGMDRSKKRTVDSA